VEWITGAIALYGAGLSSFLGYLTWRRERRRVRLFQTYQRSHAGSALLISVVNGGIRPVTLVSAHFEQPEGGYLPTLDAELGLPRKLEDGDVLAMSFDAEDVEPDTIAFVVRDSHGDEHRMDLDRDAWRGFLGHVRETSLPGLPPQDVAGDSPEGPR
jgi:hypothetical protein